MSSRYYQNVIIIYCSIVSIVIIFVFVIGINIFAIVAVLFIVAVIIVSIAGSTIYSFVSVDTLLGYGSHAIEPSKGAFLRTSGNATSSGAEEEASASQAHATSSGAEEKASASQAHRNLQGRDTHQSRGSGPIIRTFAAVLYNRKRVHQVFDLQ